MNLTSWSGAITLFLLLAVKFKASNQQSNNTKCAHLMNCSLPVEANMICDTTQLMTIPKCAEQLEMLIIKSGVIQRLIGVEFPHSFNTLRILAIRNVFLKQIHQKTFENLTKLVELDLSVNFFRTVDPELFAHNRLLERLNLSSNMIKRLFPNQFDLPNLKILDLSNNNLEFVEETAFANATSLQWLNLRTNKLKTLSFQSSTTNDNSSAVNLIMLLSNNLWNCDCNIYLVIRRYVTDENFEDSSCTDVERSQQKMWNDTNLTDNICEEEIRQQNANKIMRRERNSREDNAPDLIITIYGYVFVALSVLICMCCCCDKPKTRKIANCR